MDHLLSPETASFTEQWHFSHVVRSRGLLFCSGVTGTGTDRVVDADPERQFERAFAHLTQYLAVAGADLSDLVEITSYHVGLQRHFESFARVKDRHLPAPYPAWSAIGVAELITPGALVEIRAIAEDPAVGEASRGLLSNRCSSTMDVCTPPTPAGSPTTSSVRPLCWRGPRPHSPSVARAT